MSTVRQSEVIGKIVIHTDEEAATVEHVWLDELHGLRMSIKGHDGRWPVSTIKLMESSPHRLALDLSPMGRPAVLEAMSQRQFDPCRCPAERLAQDKPIA